MTDAQISKKLALSIGWPREDVGMRFGACCCATGPIHLRIFDYRDPAVIWPIAERYGIFPGGSGRTWTACGERIAATQYFTADTAAKAVALAVIWSL